MKKRILFTTLLMLAACGPSEKTGSVNSNDDTVAQLKGARSGAISVTPQASLGFYRIEDKACDVAQTAAESTFRMQIKGEQKTTTLTLLGDGKIAAVAFHDVKLLIKENGQRALPISVFAADGSVIATPEETTITATQLSPEQRKLLNADTNPNTVSSPVNDLLLLKISKSLGTGLKIAEKRPETDEQIYIVGYPEKTANRESLSAKDSDGTSLHCTIGKAIKFGPALKLMNRDAKKLSNTEKTDLAMKSLYSTADSNRGMAGGSVLNSKGELVGIHSSSIDEANPESSFSGASLLIHAHAVR